MKLMVRIYHTWRTRMKHSIDYKILLNNVEIMINLLEFDGMRSSGKIKLNCGHIESLYKLKEIYEKKIAKVKPKKEDK